MASNLGLGVARRDGGSIPYEVAKEMRWDRDTSRRRPAKIEDPFVAELAESIASKGQEQEILYRLDSENKPVGVGGRNRWLAVLLIGNDPERFGKKEPIPLLARKISITDKQAFEYTLDENLEKRSLTATDMAHSAAHLKDVEGWDLGRIAKKLRLSPSRVSYLIKLLTLPNSVLDLIDDGLMKEAQARALLGRPEDEAIAYAKRIRKGESAADIVREVKASKRAAGKRVAPTLAEIKAVVKEAVDAILKEDLLDAPELAESRDRIGHCLDFLNGRPQAISFLEILCSPDSEMPPWVPEPEPEPKPARAPRAALSPEEKQARAEAKAAEREAKKAEKAEKEALAKAENKRKREEKLAARAKKRAPKKAAKKKAAKPKASKPPKAPKPIVKPKPKKAPRIPPVPAGAEIDEEGEVFINLGSDPEAEIAAYAEESHEIREAMSYRERDAEEWQS